jgi:hypothetical protein
MADDKVTISITRSAGDDRAVVVFVDTTFEPDASDGGPGLRVRVNDDPVYEGKEYESGGDRRVASRVFTVGLDDIPYAEEDGKDELPEVPEDFPVQPLKPGQPAVDRVTCGTCGRSWDDAISTGWTPTPSGRCPFEYFH